MIEAMGTITKGMVGTAFLYTNRESISVGIGCMVQDLAENRVSSSALLEAFKAHPSIRSLLEGSEVREYAAHLIPEGGYKAVPQLYGEGWLVVGDAAHFVNAVHREGSNLAMTSGRIAAETVVWLKRRREACSAENLAEYRRRLEASFVMKDLKKYRGIPALLHRNKHFLDLYPRIASRAAQIWLRVDGVDKRSKEGEIVRDLRAARGWRGLVGDAFKVARAWR